MSSQGNSYIPKSIRLHHCLLALKTRQHLMVPTFFLPIFPLLLKSVVTMPGLGHCSGFELTSCLDANLLKFIHKSAALVPCYGGVGSLIHPFLAVILHWCNLSVTLWFSIGNVADVAWEVRCPPGMYILGNYISTGREEYTLHLHYSKCDKKEIHPSDFLEYLHINISVSENKNWILDGSNFFFFIL